MDVEFNRSGEVVGGSSWWLLVTSMVRCRREWSVLHQWCDGSDGQRESCGGGRAREARVCSGGGSDGAVR